MPCYFSEGPAKRVANVAKGGQGQNRDVTFEIDFAPEQWPNYNVMYRDVHHRLAKGYYP